MALVDPSEVLASMRGAYESAPPKPQRDQREEGGGGGSGSVPSLREVAAAAAARVVAQAQAQEQPRDSRGVSAGMPVGGTPSVQMMASEARPLAAYEHLARSPRLSDLVALTTRIAGDAARSRTVEWAFQSRVTAAAEEANLKHEDTQTRFGNVLDVLATGGEGPAERALACALWAHAVAEAPEHVRSAGDILWLATHTTFDATGLLDRALGEDAAEVWRAVAECVRRAEGGKGAVGRAEAVVGCAALAASGSARARTLCAELARELKDPVLLRVLATGDEATPEEVRLEGELLPAPRGPVATFFMAVTGVLFAFHAVRLLARTALAYRVPAEVSLSETGVRIKTRTEMLGRVVREREHVMLRSGLVRVVREVRFPRTAFYAGLLALALGSYIGVRAFADGVRAASPSLLVVGLAIVALGVAADFVLGTLVPGARGRCRVSFVPRSGATLCVGDVDARRADDALTRSLARPGA
jgi:hypothetical protein